MNLDQRPPSKAIVDALCSCGASYKVKQANLNRGMGRSCQNCKGANMKAAIAAAQKEKWASGTRRPNPDGYGEKGGVTRKQRMADGTMRKRRMTAEQAREYRSKVDNENLAEKNRANALLRIGVPMNTPLSAKCPTHWKAKEWAFKNVAKGFYLSGRNLNHLIRTNPQMFNKEDIVWIGTGCRAKKGLCSLCHIDKRTGKSLGSWKGWMLDLLPQHKTDTQVTA